MRMAFAFLIFSNFVLSMPENKTSINVPTAETNFFNQLPAELREKLALHLIEEKHDIKDIFTSLQRLIVINKECYALFGPLIERLIVSKLKSLSQESLDWKLELACTKGNYTYAQLLLKAGASANTQCAFCGGPLHRATRRGYTRIMQLLIDQGAEVNEKDFNEDTPLHEAIKCEHNDALVLLCKYGVDVTLKNRQSETVFKLVRKKKYRHMYRLLEKSVTHEYCKKLRKKK